MKRILILAIVIFSSAVHAESSTATLPLDDILKLYLAQYQAKQEKMQAPPVAYTLEKITLQGRLLDNAIEFSANYELSVLAEQWVEIPLLDLDTRTQLTELAQIEDGHFLNASGKAGGDSRLFFIGHKPGRYRFTLRFIKSAVATTPGGALRVDIAKLGALSTLSLKYDSGLFELRNSHTLAQGDAVLILPERNTFTVQWRQIAATVPQTPKLASKRLLQPVIEQAQASLVATLKGDTVLRVHYRLRFVGTQSIHFDIPDGASLAYVYLNAVPIPFKTEAGRLELAVEPERAGNETAEVELVVHKKTAGYLLSGRFALQLPQPSWRINQLYASLHMPDVFNYKWTGGSLSPVDKLPALTFEHSLPTPGKTIQLQQQLVSGAVDAQLHYTVDLTDRYYQGKTSATGYRDE